MKFIGNALLEKYFEYFESTMQEAGFKDDAPDSCCEKYNEQVPLFECSDKEIEQVYYFRWWTFRKHIKKTPEGIVVTEFLPQVSWSGAYNTISCAAGHHFYEGRWLGRASFLDDYGRFWLCGKGSPRDYSFWAADSLLAHAMVTGNIEPQLSLLPFLVENYRLWEEGGISGCLSAPCEGRLDKNGLFWQVDTCDGMEVTIGGHGYRPSINSYMFGDAKAIAFLAGIKGDSQTREVFLSKAEDLKKNVQRSLWDKENYFFKTVACKKGNRTQDEWVKAGCPGMYDWKKHAPRVFKPGEMADVCELIGYLPWYFNMPDPGYEKAWSFLMRPDYFYGPAGLRTAQRSHPGYNYFAPHACHWNGQSWPYATSQTLTAMANLLNNYKSMEIGKTDYLHLLKQYAKAHRLGLSGGATIPWIDENHDPDTGRWIAREYLHKSDSENKNRGRHYNHSTFCDLVITGLVGLRPRPDNIVEVNPLVPEKDLEYFVLDNLIYHGKRLSILYDREGTRYGTSPGLHIFIDGREAASCKAAERTFADL